MDGQIQTKADNQATDSISDELDAALSRLSAEQIRYVIARRESRSVTDACAAIGMRRQGFYEWPEEERLLIDDAVRLMERDGVVTAQHLRRRALAEAMAVKVAGLRSKEERTRQAVATEIIEWELGKATQRNENAASGEVVIRVKRDSDRYNPARVASRTREDSE